MSRTRTTGLSLLAAAFATLHIVAAWLAAAAGPTTAPATAPLRVVIIGDSTVCNYPASRPERGWGMFLQERFKEGTVQVINLAASGRSTKTFIEEGRWQRALGAKPDFVLIQFGHNDSHEPRNHEATDPAGDYRQFLRQYIDDARAAGATPILVTPMVRRLFDADGKITEPPPPSRPLAAYAEAMKAVAQEKKVAVIDLNASSRALAESLGPVKSAELANKKDDATHFNEKGARAMADLVLHDLPAAEPRLAPDLKSP